MVYLVPERSEHSFELLGIFRCLRDCHFFTLIFSEGRRDIVPSDEGVYWYFKVLDATGFALMGVMYYTTMHLFLMFDYN